MLGVGLRDIATCVISDGEVGPAVNALLPNLLSLLFLVLSTSNIDISSDDSGVLSGSFSLDRLCRLRLLSEFSLDPPDSFTSAAFKPKEIPPMTFGVVLLYTAGLGTTRAEACWLFLNGFRSIGKVNDEDPETNSTL